MTWEGLTPPYSTIVADPPWRVHQMPHRYGGPNRPLPYTSMTLADIEALPVIDLAAESSHLYLWTINRFVAQAYGVVRQWGFTPSTLLTWCKPPMNNLGAGGAYVLTTEFCLFARRGNGAFVERHPSSWFSLPRGSHSTKPAGFLDVVERVSPGPYVELFARQPRLGWDSWGYGYEGAA